jgi:hypothetical protein
LCFFIPLLFIRSCIEDNSNIEKNKRETELRNIKQNENAKLLEIPSEERQRIVLEKLILDHYRNALDQKNKTINIIWNKVNGRYQLIVNLTIKPSPWNGQPEYEQFLGHSFQLAKECSQNENIQTLDSITIEPKYYSLDKYGNPNEENAKSITLKFSELKKINWANFNLQMFKELI